MRVITQKMIDAFLSHNDAFLGNTVVKNDAIYLFGHRIANFNKDGSISIRDCGWCSATTQDRLNALPNVNLSRKRGEWILNGESWNGTSKTINL